MSRDTSAEQIAQLDSLTDKLEKMELNPSYIAAISTMTQLQKDNFEMIDRSLAMMQSIHTVEVKNGDYFLDIIKFLLPIFATAAITGASVDIAGLNSLLLVAVGLVGVGVSLVALVTLSIARKKKVDRQEKEYIKLSEAFSKWQKIANVQRQLASDSGVDIKDMKDLFADLTKAAESMELKK